MSSSVEGVHVTPADLKFRFQLNKQLLGNISINNTTDKRIAFKIKTTAPKKYVVRPSSGVLEPKTIVQVQVIMQAQKEFPTDFAKDCKDKFMVQTVALADGEEVDKDSLFKDTTREGLKEARLRVVLEGPAAPPSPVAEDEEERLHAAPAEVKPSPARPKPASNDIAASEGMYMRGKIDKLSQECEGLRRQLDAAQLHAATSSRASKSSPKFQLSLLHLILVAILAFILGHYI